MKTFWTHERVGGILIVTALISAIPIFIISVTHCLGCSLTLNIIFERFILGLTTFLMVFLFVTHWYHTDFKQAKKEGNPQ